MNVIAFAWAPAVGEKTAHAYRLDTNAHETACGFIGPRTPNVYNAEPHCRRCEVITRMRRPPESASSLTPEGTA